MTRINETMAFLRLAAMELHRLAERAPEIATELCHIAEQLATEARDLAREGNVNG